MSDLKHILNDPDGMSEEELLRYLEGHASEEERFAVENMMAESAFVDDAVEGLQQFKNPGEIKESIEQLNRQLQKQTQKKNSRKKKRRIEPNHWIVIAILGILLLCIIGFLLIHFQIKH